MAETHTPNLEGLVGDIEALQIRAKFNKLGGYDPYPFQKRYHACRTGKWSEGKWEPRIKDGVLIDEEVSQILLSAGNQAGKTETGGADVAIHAAGEYPDDWVGPDITELLREYPLIWCGGANNDTVRDIAQAVLCGDPNDPAAWGTGWIPKDRLKGRNLRQGVKNGFDVVMVRHKAGFLVTIGFKSYEAGLLDWAGKPVTLIWLDEEPPQQIYSQCLARTTATGGKVKMTFTPEKGATEVVSGFMTGVPKDKQTLMLVSLDDAQHPDGRTHLDPVHRKQLEESYLPHERDMRIRGLPVLGSGAVFPLDIETILCPRFDIPDSMPRIVGMDFGRGGNNHPTAAVWIAFDIAANSCWIYDCYKSAATEPSVHTQAIRSRGAWIPVGWPHDGNRKESYATDGVRKGYADMGLRMLSSHATNEDGSLTVEAGIFAIYTAMLEGRFKVFNHLTAWQEEFRMYHRKADDGSIVDSKDDLMSATRIGFLSKRYAIPAGNSDRNRAPLIIPGTNDYDPLEGM